MITIVVPVYNAYAETQRCLSALEQHAHGVNVIVIDDASTDQRVGELLATVPNAWEVLKNDKNLGFVRTANRGLALDQGHTILLNSDTIVSDGWLTGFEQALCQIENLGSATPWSNNAEIVSLPKTLTNNPIPENLDSVGQALLSRHQPTWPELPTAVGFCMLITAQAKFSVGLLDAETFGHGYGEENDYCMRLQKAGFRNVLVDNSYVAHVGNASFSALNMKPDEASMQRLLKKHPDYLNQVQNFIQNDPLNHLRESIIAKIGAF